jgi:hypothetical protein
MKDELCTYAEVVEAGRARRIDARGIRRTLTPCASKTPP